MDVHIYYVLLCFSLQKNQVRVIEEIIKRATVFFLQFYIFFFIISSEQ